LYDADGHRRWFLQTSGNYRRAILFEHRVITLSERSGALLHGELESIDRANGRLKGTAGWFGELLSLGPELAVGESDFPGDLDMWCGYAELLTVALDGGVTDPHTPTPGLATQRRKYELEKIALPPPLPVSGGGYQSQTPCAGDRNGHPKAVVDGNRIVLSSGTVLGLFANTESEHPASVVRGATLVGGPFAGRYFVSRGGVLESLRWEGAVPRRAPLWRKSNGTTFAVAGLGSTLYASDGAETVAFDATSWQIRRRYRFGCAGLTAVTHSPKVDIIACEPAEREADARVYALGTSR